MNYHVSFTANCDVYVENAHSQSEAESVARIQVEAGDFHILQAEISKVDNKPRNIDVEALA